MIVILVMDGELAQFLTVELASAMRSDPWEHLKRLFPIGLLQLGLGTPCHGNLTTKSGSVRIDRTTSCGDVLNELSAGP